jgi:hypothetical protein
MKEPFFIYLKVGHEQKQFSLKKCTPHSAQGSYDNKIWTGQAKGGPK